MSECQLEALLVRHPWGMTKAAIDLLDDWELINVYLRAGEPEQLEYGTYWPLPDEGTQKPSRTFYPVINLDGMEGWYKSWLASSGVFDEKMIERRWQDYVKSEREHGKRQRAELQRQLMEGDVQQGSGWPEFERWRQQESIRPKP